VLTSAKQNYAPSAADHHFRARGFLHEATDEWSPGLEPLVLSAALKPFAVAMWLAGKRHYERGGEAFYKEMAREFDVKVPQAKQFVRELLDKGIVTLEDALCETAKKRVPHYVSKIKDPISPS
jgi:hypothetical protein